MTTENRLASAHAEFHAAFDALHVAEAALGIGILRDAMSRAYYAVFHAARALIVYQGLQAKTHNGLARLLNDHVIHPGLLAPRFNLIFIRLKAYRQASDYAFSFDLDAENAALEIRAAREFVECARALIPAEK